MRTIREELIVACAELVQTDVGKKFLAAYTPFVEECREQLVMAPPEHMAYAQGVARQGTVLLRMIRDSHNEALKIIAKEEAAKQRG
jgi:hypothetical protein